MEKGELTAVPFDIIQKSDILSEADFAALAPLKKELKETFLKTQIFRTRTEMDVSVLNEVKFPTPASKYWQAIREQNVMFTNLVILSYEYRKKVIEIKKLERALSVEKDDLERALIQIEIEKQTFLLRDSERVAKDRIREVLLWSEIKEREAKKMDPADLVDVDRHQLISYSQQWAKQYLISDGDGTVDERFNIVGLVGSGLKECKERGVLDKVLEIFDDAQKKQLEKFYG